MFFSRIISVLLLLMVAACAGHQPPATYSAHPDWPYLLDSGDQVRVTVFGQTELSRTYLVDDSGYISVPLVGAVAARGATTKVLSDKVSSALAAGYLVDPSVAIEIAQYRPFFIQGAVVKAGSYPYMAGMTVRNAISIAGGYARTANRSTAIVYRKRNGKIIKGNVALDLPIYPGDTIEISERWL